MPGAPKTSPQLIVEQTKKIFDVLAALQRSIDEIDKKEIARADFKSLLESIKNEYPKVYEAIKISERDPEAGRRYISLALAALITMSSAGQVLANNNAPAFTSGANTTINFDNYTKTQDNTYDYMDWVDTGKKTEGGDGGSLDASEAGASMNQFLTELDALNLNEADQEHAQIAYMRHLQMETGTSALSGLDETPNGVPQIHRDTIYGLQCTKFVNIDGESYNARFYGSADNSNEYKLLQDLGTRGYKPNFGNAPRHIVYNSRIDGPPRAVKDLVPGMNGSEYGLFLNFGKNVTQVVELSGSLTGFQRGNYYYLHDCGNLLVLLKGAGNAPAPAAVVTPKTPTVVTPPAPPAPESGPTVVETRDRLVEYTQFPDNSYVAVHYYLLNNDYRYVTAADTKFVFADGEVVTKETFDRFVRLHDAVYYARTGRHLSFTTPLPATSGYASSDQIMNLPVSKLIRLKNGEYKRGPGGNLEFH